MNQFTKTDCWVLFSIEFDRKGSNLMRIICNGDRINHAIFEREELEEGLNKLLCNGFICEENRVFYVTQKAKAFYRKNNKFSEGWICISKIFIKEPTTDFQRIIIISDEEYKQALNAYYEYFDEIEKSTLIRIILKLFGLK